MILGGVVVVVVEEIRAGMYYAPWLTLWNPEMGGVLSSLWGGERNPLRLTSIVVVQNNSVSSMLKELWGVGFFFLPAVK